MSIDLFLVCRIEWAVPNNRFFFPLSNFLDFTRNVDLHASLSSQQVVCTTCNCFCRVISYARWTYIRVTETCTAHVRQTQHHIAEHTLTGFASDTVIIVVLTLIRYHTRSGQDSQVAGGYKACFLRTEIRLWEIVGKLAGSWDAEIILPFVSSQYITIFFWKWSNM